MSTSKRIISLLLALVMVLGMLPWDALGVEAAGLVETVRMSIESAKTGEAEKSASAEIMMSGDTVEVTRAQWVQELVKTFSMTVEEDNYPDNYFSDLTGDEEYYRDILVAVEFGVIDLEAGLPFEPEAAATREFCAHTLNFCLGYQLGENPEYTFSEAQTAVYPNDIQVAINRGWFALNDGAFLPGQAITTDEKDNMIQDAVEVLASDVIDPDYQNSYEFTEDVIELSAQTPVYWNSDTEIVLLNPDQKIQKGDILAVYEDGFPLVCKAENIVVTGNMYTVSITYLNINDYLLSVDAQGIMETDLADFEPAEGIEVIYVLEDGSEVNSVHAAGTQKIKSIYFYEELMGYKVDIEVYDMVLKWRSKGSSLKNADVSAVVTGHAFCNITVPFGASVADLSDVLSLGTVPIGPFGRISVTATISIDGSVSIAYGTNFSVGVSYNYHSGFRIPMEFEKTHFSMCVEANLKAGITASAGLTGVPLLSATCRATMGLQVNCTMRHRGDDVTPKLCIHTDAWLYCTVGAYATVGIQGWDAASESWSDEIVIWDRNHSPVRSVTHFEDGSIVGKCAFDDFGTIRYYSSGSSRYVNGGVSAVNNLPTYTYTLDENNNATITGYSGSISSLSIPCTIDGYPVTAIGNSVFAGNTVLCSVTFPSGVVSIGANCFNGCTGLRDVTLPDTLLEIGESAFQNCTYLMKLDLPDQLTKMGNGAFRNCTRITSVHIPKSLSSAGNENWGYDKSGAFHSCSGLKTVTFAEGMTEIPRYLFTNCTGLEHITIPDTVTVIEERAFSLATNLKTVAFGSGIATIEDGAFAECTSLEKAELPDSLTSIGEYAFANCKNMATLILPKHLTTLKNRSFYNCAAVTEIYIPKSLTSAGNENWGYDESGAFHSCSGLKTVIFEEGVTEISRYLFTNCTGIECITIPDTVTVIEERAFSYAVNLKNIDFGSNITAIEDGAFAECTGLEKAELSDTITSIGEYAFANCKNMETLVLPKHLTTLRNRSFYNCSAVTEIYIPKSLTSAGNENWGYDKSGAFHSCSGLKTVTFEEGITEIARYLFTNCTGIECITIPDTVQVVEERAFYLCPNLKTVVIPGSVTKIEGSAFQTTGLLEITIPESVSSIGSWVFTDCTSLTTVAWPSSLTTIPEYTFSGCTSLTTVNLPENLTTIQRDAFNNCDSLVTFTVPDSVTTMNENAFYDCNALQEIHLSEKLQKINNNTFYNCDSLTSITIPYGVTAIGSSAFYDCDALETVDMANSVTSLGSSAFRHCDVLKNVKLSRNLTAIPSEAFRECAELEEIVIPYFATKIDVNAFNSSPKLKKVVTHEKLATINTSAFSYADRTVFYGPTGSYTNTWCTENGYSFVENTAATTKVTAAESSVTIPKGKTYMLDFDIDPVDFHEIITTKSSNTAVATVDEAGKITAVAPGTATIKIIVGGASASCKVTVTQAVTKIQLDKTTLSLDVPETYQLTATITPSDASNKNLIWTSSNESAATVDENGLVTAVGNGTAVIKAEAADGTGISASCTVTVIDPSKIPVSSITLDKTALSLEAMGTYQLTATISPANAASKALIWTSSKEAVATVDSKGQVTALAKGTATITATAADGYGASASCTVTVTNNGYVITSMDQFQSSHPYENSCSDFWLYTQPGAGSVSITFDAETEMEDGFDYLYVYDGDGKLIGKYTGTELAGQTVTISGSTVKVQIESDDSGNAWGFRVTDIGFTDHTHSFTHYVSDGNATCTEDGTKTAKCDHCDATDTIPDAGSALGHSFGSWTVIQEPTTTEDGLEERSCARCGHTEQRTVAKLENPFKDVKPSDFYYTPVLWALENGITSGTAPDEFSPYDSCLRSQVVTFLWRAAGKPKAESTRNPFVDVKPTDYYYDAVLWAVEKGITSGADANHFEPNGVCNRSQVVTFLYRAFGKPPVGNVSNPFTDVSSSDWYASAVLWAVKEGITSGLSATKFGPNDACNRSQVVTFLYRAYVND